jgi:hypothetical protein
MRQVRPPSEVVWIVPEPHVEHVVGPVPSTPLEALQNEIEFGESGCAPDVEPAPAAARAAHAVSSPQTSKYLTI